MILVEFFETIFEVGELVAFHQSHTGTDALLQTSGDVEGDGADTVADKLVQ